MCRFGRVIDAISVVSLTRGVRPDNSAACRDARRLPDKSGRRRVVRASRDVSPGQRLVRPDSSAFLGDSPAARRVGGRLGNSSGRMDQERELGGKVGSTVPGQLVVCLVAHQFAELGLAR
jgi:hypothetical protein